MIFIRLLSGSLLFFLILVLSIGPSRADETICPGVVIYSDSEFDFSNMEKRLACGDPESEAWQDIPPYQAKIFLTGFLQSRGFLLPDFEVKENVLHVYPRGRTRIKEINVSTGEEKEKKHVKEEIQRQYRRKVLTPKVLDAIKSDGLSVVRQRGFPCVRVEAEGIADERTVSLSFKRLVPHTFGEIKKEKIKDLHENALNRFYPFEAGDSFNERLLELTQKRMRRAQVVSATYYLENCSEDAKDFELSEHFIQGPPRTIHVGVGANTESGPLFRVRWSHNLFQNMASQLSASLTASFRVQSMNLSADQFLWTEVPRRSLFSQFDLTRESQYSYLQTVARLRSHIKWTSDNFRRFWTYTLGPTLEAGSYKTEENEVSNSYKNAAIEAGIGWMSHPYEFFEIHPEDGDTFGISLAYRDPELGFDHQLFKIDSTFAKLIRMGVWERGDVVGGIRLMGGTTFVPADVSLVDLPPSVKFYGGGSDDVRGFLLRSLPKNDGLGALSKVALKLELRRTYFFREDLEAFVFMDSARFGEEPWILEPRVWYSPGVGLRWLSPIGLVQTYAARARATHPDENFRTFYFIGLGGTF